MQDTDNPVPQEDTDGTVPRDDRREETCETGVLSTVDRGVAANSQQDDNARSGSRLGQIRGSRVHFNNGSEEITSELAQDVEISPAKADAGGANAPHRLLTSCPMQQELHIRLANDLLPYRRGWSAARQARPR